MKAFLRRTLILVLGLLARLSPVFAQEKLNIIPFQRALDESYKNAVAIKDKQNGQELKKATDKMIVSFQKTIAEISAPLLKAFQKDIDETEKQLKALEQKYPSKKGRFDLPADMNGLPSPISVYGLAAKTDIPAIYQPYYDKLENKQKQLRELAEKNNLYQEIYDKEGTAGLEKRAATEVDKNPMVQQMGGVEKLKNMTDAERKLAAEKLKSEITQNPGMLLSAGADPGITSMQQKIMSDPEYAKRFSKMSEAEKETEIKKYMTVKPMQRDPNSVYTSNVQSTKAPTDLDKSRELDELLARTQKRMEEITLTNTRMASQANNTLEELKAQLANWQEATRKAIPIVELGEYGHDHDPELVQAMEITGKYAGYFIEQLEITFRDNCWKQYMFGVKSSLLEVGQYAATYEWGQGKESQLFNGTYNDPKIANAMFGYYNLLLGLAKSSEEISRDAASAQKRFEGLL